MENSCGQGSLSSFLQEVPKVVFSSAWVGGQGQRRLFQFSAPKTSINLLLKMTGKKPLTVTKLKKTPLKKHQEKGTILR